MARVAENLFRLAFVCLISIVANFAIAQITISTTQLTVSPDVVVVNDGVTFTAIVKGNEPTGQVAFHDGDGTEIRKVDLINGSASFRTVFQIPTSLRIYAKYLGDAQNTASMSAYRPLNIAEVIKMGTQANPNPVQPGQQFTVSIPSFGTSKKASFLDYSYGSLGQLTPATGTTLRVAGFQIGPLWMGTTYSGIGGDTRGNWVRIDINPDPEKLANAELSVYSETDPLPLAGYVTVKAQVLGNNPTGTVKFTSTPGVTWLGSAQLVDGVATFTGYRVDGGMAYGPHFVAEYSGDNQNAPTRTISTLYKTIPLIQLEASKQQLAIGENVTFTATVKGYYPSGSVQFLDGNVILKSVPLISGMKTSTATFTTNFQKNSNRKISAYYVGDFQFTPATSLVVQVAVGTGKADTALSISVNPGSIYFGQEVWLNASISGENPGGTIQFLDGASQIGSASINSSLASLKVQALTPGAHSLKAFYAGDANNAQATSSALSFTVKEKTATTSSLMLNSSTVVVGQPVTMTASVSGGNSTGTVSFIDGANTISNQPVAGGIATFTTSSLAQGSHTITVTYSGDVATNQSKSSPINLTVLPKTSSTIKVTASPNPALSGQLLTLNAIVSGTLPTGSVTFSAGPRVLGSAVVSGNKAIIKISDTALINIGSNIIIATYSGDASNVWSTTNTELVMADGVLKLDNYLIYSADVNQDGCVDYLAKTKEGTVTPVFVLLSIPGCSYSLSNSVSQAQSSATWTATSYQILSGDVRGEANGSLILLPSDNASAPVFNIARNSDKRTFALIQTFKASELFNNPASVKSLIDVDGDGRTDLVSTYAGGIQDVYQANADGTLNLNAADNRAVAATWTWKSFIAQAKIGSVDGALGYVSVNARETVREAMTVPDASLPNFANAIKRFEILSDENNGQVRAAVIFGIPGEEEMFIVTFGKEEGGTWKIISM